MRIIPTEEMDKIWEQIEPYLVRNGIKMYVSPDAPPEIKNLYKKFLELSEAQWKEAGMPV